MKVNKISTMYRYNDKVNFFGVPFPNPLTLKQDLHRVCVVYPDRTSYSSHSINYRHEYGIIPEESKFGNIPLGVI